MTNINNITIVFTDIVTDFPDVAEFNLHTKAQNAHNEMRSQVNNLDDFIVQLNLRITEINAFGTESNSLIADFEVIRDTIINGVTAIDIEALESAIQQINDLNIIAENVQLIQDVSDDVKSVAKNYLNKDEDYTAIKMDYIKLDATSAILTITCPTNPTENDRFWVYDNMGMFTENIPKIVSTDKNIMGLDEEFNMDIKNAEFEIFYNGIEWRVK